MTTYYDNDLSPIVPNGRNPLAIERAFQLLNARIDNVRALVLGLRVMNDAGVYVRDDSGSFVRTPAVLG